ncbi:hypothetical protein ACS5PN_26935 [Roseateles sp. NT4]|uniref:hypothetical protein n=1 Tax=Roseateles sp. NT4 TaxID=3453715 RepID=UPI003EEEB5BA
MPVTATLRVVPLGNDAPPPEVIRDAVARLRDLGIRVIDAGMYSVIVMIDPVRFERILGVRAPGEGELLAQDITPRERSLQGVIDRVEIAPPVTYLDM